MNTKEKIEVMQAFENGHDIQARLQGLTCEQAWNLTADPEWAWNYCDYRIKQQPKTVTLYYYSYNGKVEIFDTPLDPSLNSVRMVRMAHASLIKTETIEVSE